MADDDHSALPAPVGPSHGSARLSSATPSKIESSVASERRAAMAIAATQRSALEILPAETVAGPDARGTEIDVRVGYLMEKAHDVRRSTREAHRTASERAAPVFGALILLPPHRCCRAGPLVAAKEPLPHRCYVGVAIALRSTRVTSRGERRDPMELAPA